MDHWGIVANVDAPDSALRLGARVVVMCIPGNEAHVFVRGLSRGGRVIEKWTMSNRLTNIRPAYLHRPHEWGCVFATRADARSMIESRFGAGDRGAAR